MGKDTIADIITSIRNADRDKKKVVQITFTNITKKIVKILLQEGMAKVATYPPNVRYVDDFKALEKTAREGNKGLWAYSDDSANISAPTTPIVTPNNSTSSNQYTDESGNGLIKGNISSSGEKIYHMPGMRDYNKTKIDISKGEKWFKTEQEALDAGFRKAMQ